MSDEPLQSVMTHGISVLGGGTVSAVVLRLMFADVAKQLAGIGSRLDKLDARNEVEAKESSTRHESSIERFAKLEQRVDAAWRDIDELKRRRK